MDHISDNELLELLEGRMPADRRTTVLAELQQCPTCRDLARDWATSSVRFDATPEDTAPRQVVVPEGATVGPYQIEELIGAGAMGLVFRARDPALDRTVAIKLVSAGDAGALDEGRLLATVRHRNVIAAHAAGTSDGVAYLVMELVDGTSLDRLLRDGSRSTREAARWFAGVADGLAAAHAAGVVHRDIKPANLLLDRDELRIADFGLAATAARAPAGTLAYAAPEVVGGGAATAKSDQFSFFVTLYEALSRRRPFAGHTADELKAAWRAPVRQWPAVPSRLRRAMARGLAIDPDARWPDMTAVARELRASTRSGRWVWVAGPAVVLAIAATVVVGRARGAASCDAPHPSWATRAPAALRALAAGHETRWRAAYARTCAGPLAPKQRACLTGGRARVDAILDALGAAPDAAAIAGGQQALASAAPPERCLTHPELAPATVDPGPVRTAAALFALGRSQDAKAALPADPAGDDAATALLRGQIARDLSDPDAEPTLRRAAELASRDDLAPVLADAQTELALVVGVLGDGHQAGAAYVDAAIATAARLGDARRAALARVIGGLIAYGKGDPDGAVAAITGAIDALPAAGATPLELAGAEMRLGWVLREVRRSAEARVHLGRALAGRKAALGDDHPLVGYAETELGMVDALDGDFPAAIARYRSVIARFTTLLGETHGVVMGGWAALGAAQVGSGDYAGAETSFANALELRRRRYGDRHIDVARAHLNIASTRYYQGKFDDALASYRAAEATSRSILGGDHPEVAQSRAGIALALHATGRLAEAADEIQAVIAIYRAKPGNDAALADALQTRGMILFGNDDLVGSRAALEEGLAIQTSLYGADHVGLASVTSTLAELYLAQRALPEAERAAQHALDLRTKHGVAPQLVAETEFVLAMIVWARGEKGRAKDVARAALAHLGDARPDLRELIEAWLKKPH